MEEEGKKKKKLSIKSIRDNIKMPPTLEEEIDEEVEEVIEKTKYKQRETYDGVVFWMLVIMLGILGVFYFYIKDTTLISMIAYILLNIVTVSKMVYDWIKLRLLSYKIVNDEVYAVLRQDSLKGLEKNPYDLFTDKEWEKLVRAIKRKKIKLPYVSVVKRSMSKGYLSEGSARAFILGDKIETLIGLESKKLLIYLNTLYPYEINKMITPKEEQVVQTIVKLIMTILIIFLSPNFTIGLTFIVLIVGSYNILSEKLVREKNNNLIDINYEEFEKYMDLDMEQKMEYNFPYTINTTILSYFLYYAKTSRGFTDDELMTEIMAYIGKINVEDIEEE